MSPKSSGQSAAGTTGKSPRGKSSAASERAARAAALQKEAKATERRRAMMLWGAVGLVLVLIVGGVGFAIYNGVANRPEISENVETFENLGQTHVPDAVTYEQTPPVGGDHNAIWLNCDIYEEPVPNWHAVHALEHGAVWLTYDPSDPAVTDEQIDRLRELANAEYMLMSPYPDQGAPIKATAWGLQLSTDDANDPQIEEFIRMYNRGPQTLEPGAACSGGTSVDLVQGG